MLKCKVCGSSNLTVGCKSNITYIECNNCGSNNGDAIRAQVQAIKDAKYKNVEVVYRRAYS